MTDRMALLGATIRHKRWDGMEFEVFQVNITEDESFDVDNVCAMYVDATTGRDHTVTIPWPDLRRDWVMVTVVEVEII